MASNVPLVRDGRVRPDDAPESLPDDLRRLWADTIPQLNHLVMSNESCLQAFLDLEESVEPYLGRFGVRSRLGPELRQALAREKHPSPPPLAHPELSHACENWGVDPRVFAFCGLDQLSGLASRHMEQLSNDTPTFADALRLLQRSIDHRQSGARLSRGVRRNRRGVIPHDIRQAISWTEPAQIVLAVQASSPPAPPAPIAAAQAVHQDDLAVPEPAVDNMSNGLRHEGKEAVSGPADSIMSPSTGVDDYFDASDVFNETQDSEPDLRRSDFPLPSAPPVPEDESQIPVDSTLDSIPMDLTAPFHGDGSASQDPDDTKDTSMSQDDALQTHSPEPRASLITLDDVMSPPSLKRQRTLVPDPIDGPKDWLRGATVNEQVHMMVAACRPDWVTVDSLLTNADSDARPHARLIKELVQASDQLVLPLHLANHWALVTIQLGGDGTDISDVAFMDSLRRPNHVQKAQDRVRSFLTTYYGITPPQGDILREVPCAEQSNGVDCGVHTIINAAHLAVGVDIPLVVDASLWRCLVAIIDRIKQDKHDLHSHPLLAGVMRDNFLDSEGLSLCSIPPAPRLDGVPRGRRAVDEHLTATRRWHVTVQEAMSTNMTRAAACRVAIREVGAAVGVFDKLEARCITRLADAEVRRVHLERCVRRYAIFSELGSEAVARDRQDFQEQLQQAERTVEKWAGYRAMWATVVSVLMEANDVLVSRAEKMEELSG